MKKLKTLVRRILRPGLGWVALLTPVSAAALIIVLATERDASPLAYAAYVLSAYTLTVLIVNFTALAEQTRLVIQEGKHARRLKEFLYSHPYGKRYMTELSFRVRVSLYASLAMNLLYATFKLVAGIYYASFWYGADAIYYIVLSAARVMLMRHMRKGGHSPETEYRIYRSCGVLLFALNAALTGVVYQIVNQNMGYRYPGLLIYAVAAFTFINIIWAIINAVKYRRLNSPVLLAVKELSLAKALVAVFALQSAMFASFSDGNMAFEQVMNSVIGGLICLSIFAMAVLTVIRANGELRKLREKTAV